MAGFLDLTGLTHFKTKLLEVVGNLYLGKNEKAKSAEVADTATNALNALPKQGDSGAITTFESMVNASTVNEGSARSMVLGNGGSLTVENGSWDKSWITVVALEGGASVNFGGSWAWSGSAPTLGKGLLTLAWYGRFGVATFTKFGS